VTASGRAELGRRLVERAYLEGDFVLRSGRHSRYYLDKYRFETDPELLAGLGGELAEMVRAHAPDAALLAGPELGAVPLTAAASMEAGLPFVIVRKDTKAYGTGNRLEGVWAPGTAVCIIEDVVTSGGALLSAISALRAEKLDVCAAISVVDRQEGGAAAIAAEGVPYAALFTVESLGLTPTPQTA
jgi:orotate phosphoribosyltransferase